MGADAVTPALPPGFVLDGAPPLPAGFVLDAGPSAAQFQQPPNLLERAAHGVNNVWSAAKQKYLMATDPAAAQAYTQQMNEDEAIYQRGLDKGAQQAAGDLPPGPARDLVTRFVKQDTPSELGQSMMLAPTMFAGGGPVVGGAVQGAVSGFLTPTQKPSWFDTAVNTAKGAGTGAVIGGVAGAKPAAPAALPAEMQARVDAMKAVGVDNPPLPAITRAPQDWYNFVELGKQDGKPKDAFVAAGQQVNDALSQVLPGMRGAETSPYAAAEQAREGVQQFARQEQGKVSQAYTAAQEAEGRGDFVNPKPFFDSVDQLLETHSDVIPAPVAQRIEALRQSTQETPAPAAFVKPKVDAGKDDIITAIRKLGGLNPDDERIGQSFVTGNPFNGDPRLGPVWSRPIAGQKTGIGGIERGKSLDDMAQALHEQGYISGRNELDEVLDKIADSTMGTPQYSSYFDHDAAARAADPLVGTLDRLADVLYTRNQPKQPAAVPFTVGEAAKLYDLVTKRMSNAPDGQVRYAGGQIKQALADTFAQSPEAAGAAGTAFRDAVAKARERFQALEPAPINRLSKLDEANPAFFANLFQSGKPGEISALYSMLQKTAPDAAQAMRSQLLDYLHGKATQSANGRFSGAALGKAIDQVGPERLAAVLSPAELARLQQLRTASEALTVAPDMAGVNTSNTASAAGNMLRKVAGAVGPVAGAGIGGFIHHQFPDLPGLLPEMAGAALGTAGQRIAASADARRMAQMLNPNLQQLARAQQPKQSILAQLLMQQRTPIDRLLPLLAQ